MPAPAKTTMFLRVRRMSHTEVRPADAESGKGPRPAAAYDVSVLGSTLLPVVVPSTLGSPLGCSGASLLRFTGGMGIRMAFRCHVPGPPPQLMVDGGPCPMPMVEKNGRRAGRRSASSCLLATSSYVFRAGGRLTHEGLIPLQLPSFLRIGRVGRRLACHHLHFLRVLFGILLFEEDTRVISNHGRH